MARRQFVLSLLFLILPLCAVVFILFHASPEIAFSPRKQERTKAAQERRGVRKELFMNQPDGNRLELLLLSERSRLHILPQSGHRVEVVEELENISCAFQEKLTTSIHGEKMQQIRTATADHGVYTYATGELVAFQVHLGLLQAPGHSLTLPCGGTPLMKGFAEKVSLRIAHGAPRFEAEKLKAQLYTARPAL